RQLPLLRPFSLGSPSTRSTRKGERHCPCSGCSVAHATDRRWSAVAARKECSMSKPYKIVYGIRKTGLADEQGQERDQWTQIGVAFPNQDGSLNVILHYLPADVTQTRLHIRDPRPKSNHTRLGQKRTF